MAIDSRVPNHVYYYTDLDTFKLILEHGTLRFKESTSSNDLLDTKRLYDRVLPVLEKQMLSNVSQGPECEFIKNYTQTGHMGSTRVSMVACFTEISDSRMLWDAYTMHRKGREADRYNGVCLEIDTTELNKCIEKITICDYKMIMPIMYGDQNADQVVSLLMENFSKEVKELQKDNDQSQELIPPIRTQLFSTVYEFNLKKCLVYPVINLLDGFDKLSPFCKHSFWNEEKEVRAVVSLKKAAIDVNGGVQHYSDDGQGYYYLDLPITTKCISKVILGPEFTKTDMSTLKNRDYKIKIERIKKAKSNGTGVIINR